MKAALSDRACPAVMYNRSLGVRPFCSYVEVEEDGERSSGTVYAMEQALRPAQ